MCGAGTTLVDGVCVADGRLGADAGVESDAGPTPDSGPGTTDAGRDVDAGTPEWGLNPPGTAPPPTGCDNTTGECDRWEAELLALVSAARACSTPLTIDAGAQNVASAHAAHQASVDRLTASSPAGDLFAQVRAAGSAFQYAGAAFSVTRDGPTDAMQRWAVNPDTADVLDGCWTGAGLAIETSASGASYVSVLLLR